MVPVKTNPRCFGISARDVAGQAKVATIQVQKSKPLCIHDISTSKS